MHKNPRNRHVSPTHRLLLLPALVTAVLTAGCGGTGYDPAQSATTGSTPAATTGSSANTASATPTVQPIPVPVAVPPLPAPMPDLSSKPITLSFGGTVGNPGFWPNGDTAAGGHGDPIDGIECNAAEAYHVHAHLTIIRDGQMLAVPALIGLPDKCSYELHTHDLTGEIHIEATMKKHFTLGQFFAVWGEPLSLTNVAGLTGQPVAVYINDGNVLSEFKGNPGDVELLSHRAITIVVGAPVKEIPTFFWDTPA